MKVFNHWEKKEIILLVSSVFIVLLSGLLAHSNILTIVCSITGITCAITQAKGKVISQFIGLLLVTLYSIISFKNKYYGEMIIYICIMLPLFIIGIFSWMRNVDLETNKVKKNTISKREWIILIIILIVLTVLFYYALKAFNTNQLIVSTISLSTSFMGTYLLIRRSKYSFKAYMLNDLVTFLLWGITVLESTAFIPIIINPIVLFINDLYGWKNWNK